MFKPSQRVGKILARYMQFFDLCPEFQTPPAVPITDIICALVDRSFNYFIIINIIYYANDKTYTLFLQRYNYLIV